jgi:thiamine transport system permease protein
VDTRLGGDRASVTATAPRLSPATVLVTAVGVAVPLCFVGVFFLWPLGAILARGLTGESGLASAIEVLTAPRTLRVVGQTLLSAALAAAISTVLGLPLAHVLYRLRFPGVRVLRALVIVPFVLPTVVVGVAFRTLLREGGPLGGLGLDGTLAGIVAALVFFNVAVVARTVGGVWSGLDARREEAARVLGAGPARVFATVTLPRIGPSLAASASIVFLFCATAFGVVLVMGGSRFSTIETEIYVLTTQFLDLQGAAVLSIAQLAVVVLVLVVAGRFGRAAAERGIGRGARRPRSGDTLAIVASLVVAAMLAAPVVTLVARSLRTDSGWSLEHYVALATSGSRNALSVTAWEALGNSLGIALAATVLALLVGVTSSLVLSRTPRAAGLRRAILALDAVLMLPLGVSAVTVGFGFLITLNRPPLDLRSSIVLVPIAQALVAVPLVVRTLLPALRGVDPRLRESAATLGASPLRVLRDVDLGLVARPLLVAAGFAFAVALGEFGATSFLSRPDQATLPVVIGRLVNRPGGDDFGMALAASVVLAAITTLVVAAIERLQGEPRWAR